MTKKMGYIVVLALLAQLATASSITGAAGSNLGTVTTNVNLTATGPVDWAEWSTLIGTPTQSKTNGTAISDLTITTSTVAGVSYAVNTLYNILYSWTDGSPAATTNDFNPPDPRLTTGTGIDAMAGTGAKLSFAVAGTTALRTVTIWGCSANVGASITASLAGASDVTTLIARNGTIDNVWTYSVSFQADNPGDLLTLIVNPYDSRTGNTIQERLGIGAVTVAGQEVYTFYTLTVASGTGGGSYTNGTQVPISATPIFGKIFDQWTGDIQYVASVSSSNTTVTMPANAVSLTATYVDAPSYTLTASAGANGTVSPSSTNVIAGGSADFVVTADSGYRIASLTTNGTPVAGLLLGNFSTSANFTWANVHAAGALVATFTPQVASATIITNAAVENLGAVTTNVNLTTTGPVDWVEWSTLIGTPTQSKSGGAAIGDLTITTNTSVSYASSAAVNILYSWTDGTPTNTASDLNPIDPRLWTAAGVDAMAGTGAKLSFTVAGSTAPQTVTIWGCSLKVGAEVTASIDGSNVVTQLPRLDNASDNIWKYSVIFRANSTNDVLTLTVSPYDSWTGNNTQERLGIGAVTVSSSSYYLTVTGGTGSGSYTNGAVVAIAADAPVPGMTFDVWTGDTQYVASVSASNTTVTMPANAVALTATYKSAAVILTASAGANGTVTPASTNVVPGNSADFVITASNYYRIATLTTNGTPVTGVTFDNSSTTTNFTWSNVQAAGTLAATFTAQLANDPAGTPYSWLAGYGLTNYDTDAVADQDLDGLKTWQEYIAGTDPTNKASCLKVAQTNRNTVTWSPVAGRLYSVYWSTNLVKGFTNLATGIQYPQGSYTNTTPDVKVNHYQVRVQLP